MDVTLNFVEGVMETILHRFSDNDQAVATIKSTFDNFKNRYDRHLTGYCIGEYVQAELDFHTSGKRGIGRMTDDVPRFGAYFGKWLKNMESLDLFLFENIIRDTILAGYLCQVICENPLKDVIPPTGHQLYEKWIPTIYASDPNDMSEGFTELFWSCTEDPLLKLKGLLASHGMKGGGLFSEDKTARILVYYPFAGFLLRVAETNPD